MVKLRFDIPEEKIKISFKIKKSLSKGLKDYSEFISTAHDVLISQDIIIESLIEKVLKDKEFTNFLISKNEINNTKFNSVPKKEVKEIQTSLEQ